MQLLPTVAIGAGIGFLGGLLGKGGSAIATPLLHAIGVPPILAVASPLPGTIPSTFLAGRTYARAGQVDRRVAAWVIAAGVPATVAGALASRWVGGGPLVLATDVVLVLLGLRLALRRPVHTAATEHQPSLARIIAVAVAVGVIAGLLANSGGFLLAPLFVTALGLPIARALGTSLVVATVLALPGTVVHAALGHVDWALVAVLTVSSLPLSYAGARVALRTDPARLERGYGVILAVLGVGFLVFVR